MAVAFYFLEARWDAEIKALSSTWSNRGGLLKRNHICGRYVSSKVFAQTLLPPFLFLPLSVRELTCCIKFFFRIWAAAEMNSANRKPAGVHKEVGCVFFFFFLFFCCCSRGRSADGFQRKLRYVSGICHGKHGGSGPSARMFVFSSL